jgi:hypothetical protein
VLGTHVELLGHIGDDEGLADGLPAGDRQRLVGVSSLGEIRLDEIFARHLVERTQHVGAADAAAAQAEQEAHALLAVIVCRRGRRRLLRVGALALARASQNAAKQADHRLLPPTC